jgi:hypothetical protein
MTRPIFPDQLQHLLAGYVLYDLSPEESATLAALLATNPDLQQEIEQLQRTLEVAYDSSPISPPSPLRDSVLRAADALPVAAPAPAPHPASRTEERAVGGCFWRRRRC